MCFPNFKNGQNSIRQERKKENARHEKMLYRHRRLVIKPLLLYIFLGLLVYFVKTWDKLGFFIVQLTRWGGG